MIPTSNGVETPSRRSSETIGTALWSSAIDAFVKTILVLVMGNLTLGILGGIFSAMTPSAPPFFANNPGAHSNSNSSLMRTWWSGAHEHQFAIVYMILFALGARTRLLALFPGATSQTVATETRFQKISVRLCQDWFRLIVGNAFGALISAIVIYFVETFTGTRFLVTLLLAAVLPGVKAMATFVVGSRIVNFVGGMFNWYGDNQLRFNFWILYVAAVCDDLGIPNLKTLARFLWSRWRRRPDPTQSAV
jgi:hypothetical protein